MASFANIPTELKLNIFEKLGQEGKPSDLLNASLVCHKWKDMCLPVLWTHIHLTNENLPRFVECLEAGTRGRGESVRSLSLYIKECPDRYLRELPILNSPELRELRMRCVQLFREIIRLVPEFGGIDSVANELVWVDWLTRSTAGGLEVLLYLVRLAGTLPTSLVSLKNFSLVIWHDEDFPIDQPQYLPKEFRIPHIIIERLLIALPQTCTSLEIDSNNRGGHREFKWRHICSTIRRIIPRLHCLRIGYQDICPCLFDPHPTNEEAQDLNLHKTMFPNMKLMSIIFPKKPRSIWSLESSPDIFCGTINHDYVYENVSIDGPLKCSAVALNVFARDLRSWYENGMFPKAERLSVSSAMDMSILELSPDPYRSYDRIISIDVMGNSVKTVCDYQFLAIGVPVYGIHSWKYALRSLHYIQVADDVNPRLIFPRGLISVSRLDTSWKTSSSGVRYPASTSLCRQFKFDTLKAEDVRDVTMSKDQLYEYFDREYPYVRDNEGKLLFEKFEKRFDEITASYIPTEVQGDSVNVSLTHFQQETS
ncbi:hypothetical protein P280DRAFT_265829 [Massarina eburnea CBS 473.64]|uniref:F-box domain-containing protein n=1 Tax=Massarina eburnea CBS 473.64 TaxID=1395130 RepID=A0A6A6S3I1_9PLEO|nr:hypothetical protein P280DRAFT_265829 [Massarina eburnea CBS 473.64]